MANHFLPTLTSLYTDFLSLFSARVDDAMKQNRTDTVTLTNPPTGAVRWNVGSRAWEHNTGTPASPVWATLASSYNIVADNATKWSTARSITASGDISGVSGGFDGSANLGISLTLSTVNSNVGTYGSAAAVPILTVNGKGLITAVNTAALGNMATQSAGSVAVTGGAISGTAITLVQSTTAAPTAEGRMEWDTDNDTLMVGGSGVTRVISPDNIPATLSGKTFTDSIKRTGAGVGHLEGSYPTVENGATSGAIYSIGGAYQPNSGNLGNMYGVGYTLSDVSGISVAGLSGGPYWGFYGASGGTARWFVDCNSGRGFFNDAIYSFGHQCVYNTGTWNIAVTGNSGTATTLLGDQTSYAGYRSNAVANMLGWKNYGNGHVIFDTSAGTSPTGSAVNSTNSAVPWSGAYPVLMGWNGSTTYGVRVDSARVADSAATAGSAPASDVYAWAKASVKPTYTAAEVGAQATLGYMQVQDQKSSGTNGGTNTTGANTRVLNTTLHNTISGASLSGNAVTLPAGTYVFSGWSTECGNSSTDYGWVVQAAYISDGTEIVGRGEYNPALAFRNIALQVSGRFVIGATQTLILRTYFEKVLYGTTGLGFAASSGKTEVYSNLEIWKIA